MQFPEECLLRSWRQLSVEAGRSRGCVQKREAFDTWEGVLGTASNPDALLDGDDLFPPNLANHPKCARDSGRVVNDLLPFHKAHNIQHSKPMMILGEMFRGVQLRRQTWHQELLRVMDQSEQGRMKGLSGRALGAASNRLLPHNNQNKNQQHGLKFLFLRDPEAPSCQAL